MEPVDRMRRRLPCPRKLEVIRELGRGSFGTVDLVRDPYDGEEYARKSEPLDARVPQLELEWKVYRRLLGVPGVPIAYAMWDQDGCRRMAIQLLGPSLAKCITRIMRWDVVNWIFPKALRVIEDIHNKELLHRDIKPENLLTGRSGLSSRELYMVDFGLCKRFRMDDVDHIPFREGKHLTGTERYASVWTHQGEEQSRRDDLMSLGYVMVFLIRQTLPWVDPGGATRATRQANILRIKQKTTIEELCLGLPPGFVHYFRTVQALEFDEAPDYALLRGYLAAPRAVP